MWILRRRRRIDLWRWHRLWTLAGWNGPVLKQTASDKVWKQGLDTAGVFRSVAEALSLPTHALLLAAAVPALFDLGVFVSERIQAPRAEPPSS